MSMCRIEFTPPRDAPPHVRDAITVKGRPFPVGKVVEVEDFVAAACINGMAGWWKVHSGEPKPRPTVKVSEVKAVARAQAQVAQSMTVDGGRALQSLPALSPAAIKALASKGAEADEALKGGAFDEEAGLIAIFLWTVGEKERAVKYADRAQAVANAKAINAVAA